MVVADGNLIILKPVPSRNPPQEPEYQYHFAPVPRLPPFKFKVIEPPGQITVGLAEIELACKEVIFTIKETLLQTVVLHVPSALTKYIVVVVGEIVIEEPFPITLLPHCPANHFQLPPFPRLPPEILNVT